VIGVIALRRRVRLAAWLALLLVLAAGGAGARLGWLTRPAPVSYATDEGAWLLARLRPAGVPPAPGVGAALRARVVARRREELRYTAADVERRAAAAMALGRSVEPLRARAPEAVAAVETAVRALALTLTSPEFRDLDARRGRLRAWFAALEERLAAARDETDVAAVARALDPAAMAPVSMRAVREDLERVDAATATLVRALAGGGVSVAATSALGYDEGSGVVATEDRYTVRADPPLRIVGLDVGLLRRRGEGGGTHTLRYETAAEASHEIQGRAVALPDGAARVVVVERWTRAAAARPVRPLLRLVSFTQVTMPREDAKDRELWVTVALDGVGGAAPMLVVDTPAPRLARLVAPRYSLFYVSRPGTVSTGEAADEWVPSAPTPADGAAVETVPRTALFRNAAFAWLAAYLYVPNPTTILALVGLAALVGVLTARRRAGPAAAGGG
jgi:hypothetical protein